MTVPAIPSRSRRTPIARRPLLSVATILWVLVVVLVAAGCGATTPSPSASAATATGAPSGADSSGAPTPRPTSWPGSTADGIIALGSGATEVARALSDLQRAVDNSDPKGMLGAAQGFNRLLKDLEPNIARVSDFPLTKPVADQTRQAFDILIPATQALSDDLLAGRSAAIAGDITKIGQGMGIWTQVVDRLSDLTEQALEQKRLLTE
jgi:hypothetical protein